MRRSVLILLLAALLAAFAFVGCKPEPKPAEKPAVKKLASMAFDSSNLLYKLNADNATCTLTDSASLTATEVAIPSHVLFNATYEDGTTGTESIKVTKIGSAAFDKNTSITKVTIPDTVTEIMDTTKDAADEGAFCGCTSLASITIPKNVEKIGKVAFRDCTKLASLTLEEGVKTIGGYAFYNCTALETLTIPDSVTSIGGYAFCSDSNITMMSLGKASLGQGVFAESGTGTYTFRSMTLAEIHEMDSYKKTAAPKFGLKAGAKIVDKTGNTETI